MVRDGVGVWIAPECPPIALTHNQMWKRIREALVCALDTAHDISTWPDPGAQENEWEEVGSDAFQSFPGIKWHVEQHFALCNRQSRSRIMMSGCLATAAHGGPPASCPLHQHLHSYGLRNWWMPPKTGKEATQPHPQRRHVIEQSFCFAWPIMDERSWATLTPRYEPREHCGSEPAQPPTCNRQGNHPSPKNRHEPQVATRFKGHHNPQRASNSGLPPSGSLCIA